MIRFIHILIIFVRYRLDLLIPTDNLPWYVRFSLSFCHIVPCPSLPRGERIRLALTESGPIFIKLGQMLSTRRDLLAHDIADELALLQDQVPPFATDIAIQRIEQELKQPIASIFKSVSPIPLASASIAQVHSAQLVTGEDVVIKVTRPGLLTVIEQDIAWLMKIARFIERYVKDGSRLHPVSVVKNHYQTLLDELDLIKEAAHTRKLKSNFQSSDLLYIPKVYWSLTTMNVMVCERIYGIPVSDIATLNKHQVDLQQLAERGVDIFFRQVFDDNFFHADMHPGNIFVAIENPNNPSFIAVDCAIMGSLTQQDQYYIAHNLLAFFRQDYYRVAQLHIDSNWVPKTTNVHEFEAIIRGVCEPIFAKPLNEISFGQVLIQLFQTAERFSMEVQPQLILLQKTLLQIEGLGRQLYPQLDLWKTGLPHLERWAKQRFNPLEALAIIKNRIPYWLSRLPETPDLMFNALDQLKDHKEVVSAINGRLKVIEKTIKEDRAQRFYGKLALMATAIGLVLAWTPIESIPVMSGILWLIALVLWVKSR